MNGQRTERTETEVRILPFTADLVDRVMAFERRLRAEEPDTFFWEPDEAYRKQLTASFTDGRFRNAVSFVAVRDGNVIGRIDASLIASRSDAACCSAYLDWICVLPSERHAKVARRLLDALRKDLKEKQVVILIALMAQNGEAQRFYRAVEGAEIHDEGIWIHV